MSSASSSVPPEFRVTFPLSVGCVDAFHPNSLFPILAALPALADSVTSFTQLRATEKSKTDEYLLFDQPSLQNYNVKFGEAGRTFDVKQKLPSPSDAELWINVTKGTLPSSSASSSSSSSSSAGDIAALSSALRTTAATEKTDDKQHALNEIAEALSVSAAASAASISSVTRVFTRKHLRTLKVPLASSQTFILEQIDFSVWPSASSSLSSSSRRVFRSISLEGSVPTSVREHLLQLLNVTTFIYGGFPTMLASVLKTAPKPLELTETV